MKRLSFALVFACIVMALGAQTIRVKYQGSKPTIGDFAWAVLSDYDDNGDGTDESMGAMLQAWKKYRKGKTLDKSDFILVDDKNGYAEFESTYENQTLRIEMCFWNESDGKHKLVAYNVASYTDGKYTPGQFDGLTFYRYTNSTKKMTCLDNAPGFNVQYGTNSGEPVSYTLPCEGKDITVTTWSKLGKKKQSTLKWNGRKFTK